MHNITSSARAEAALREHHREYFIERGIDPYYAESLGFCSMTAREAAQALGRKQVPSDGLAMPYARAEPRYLRFRVDDPGEDGPRYLAPSGVPVPIYLAPGFDYGRGNLFVVESPTKAAALAQYGFAAIGLGGVSTTLKHGPPPCLNESWSAVHLVGREVYLVSDADRGTNPEVARAEYRLGAALTAARANVWVTTLDRYAAPGHGPDDFLAEHDIDALADAIGEAEPFALEVRVRAASALDELYENLPWKVGLTQADAATQARVEEAIRARGGKLGHLRRVRQEAHQALETKSSRTVSAPTFLLADGMVAEKKRRGAQAVVNCELRVTRERLIDDGLNPERRELTILARAPDGTELGTATISPAQLRDPTWIAEAFGPAVQAFTSATQVMTAVSAYSAELGYVSERVHAHTGWTRRGDEWVYLHAGGAADGSPTIVELEPALRGYRLPDAPRQPEVAIRRVLDLHRVASPDVAVLLLGAVAAAPLTSVLAPEMALMLHGPSGGRKTTLASVLLSCFGARRPTLSWSSTPTAIEGVIFSAKDSPVVVDDYVPDEAGRADALIERIVRDVANRQARTRSGADLVTRPERPARGLLILTGEQLPARQASITARILGARVEPDSVNLDVLSGLQRDADLLPHAALDYVRWLAPRYEQLVRGSGAAVRALACSFDDVAAHARTATALAPLRFAIELFLDFAVERGAVTTDDRAELSSWANVALRSLGELHGRASLEQDPCSVFWAALCDLISSRSVEVKRIGVTPKDDQQTPFIGWEDSGKELLLLQGPLMTHVRGSVGRAGGHLPVSNAELLRRLLQEGWLERGEDREHPFTSRRTISGSFAGPAKRQHVLVLHPPAAVWEALGVTPRVPPPSTRAPRADSEIVPPQITLSEPWGAGPVVVAERDGPNVLLRDLDGSVRSTSSESGIAEALEGATVVGHGLLELLGEAQVRLARAMDTRVQAVLIDGSSRLPDDQGHYDLRALAEREGLSPDQPLHEIVPSLLRRQEAQIQTLGLGKVRKLEHLVLPAVIDMMDAGIRVDAGRWDALCRARDEEQRALRDRLEAHLGVDPDDPAALVSGLATCGIVVERASKEQLAPHREHPLVKDLLRYRKLRAFGADLGPKISRAVEQSVDGRVHAVLDPLGTATGRFTARGLNLLGVEDAPEVRRCFIAEPGNVLLSLDYKAADLCALAAITGDESLTRAFRQGADVHRRTAAAIYGVAEEAATDEQRACGKVINFAVAFGCGEAGLAEFAATNFGLVIDRRQASSLLEAFARSYPGVAQWKREVEMDRSGEARSLYGRARRLDPNDLPARLNAPVQMTTSDALKIAIVVLHEELPALGARLLLPLHDELLFEVPVEAARDVALLATDVMEEAMHAALGGADVPCALDVRSGPSWGELSELGSI